MKRSLHEYKIWRQSLIPLENEVILQWNRPYYGVNSKDQIKVGQCFKITKCRDPLIGEKKCSGDLVYDLISCSKNGKMFKRHFAFSVESIARFIEDGEVSLIF